MINTNFKFSDEKIPQTVVKFKSLKSLALSYQHKIKIYQKDRESTVINISIIEEDQLKGVAFLNMLTENYIKKEIEEKNILEASLIAMERAYKSLNINAEMVIVDGINIPKINTNVKAIKNGDNKSISIASASIIAKVIRDKLMEKLSKKYPKFLWEKNSGYGTKKHIENIKKGAG